MDQSVSRRGETTGYDASGDYWVIGTVDVRSGAVQFKVDGEQINAPGRLFAIAVPPQSVVEYHLTDVRSSNSAVFSKLKPPRLFPDTALVWPLDVIPELNKASDIEDLLASIKCATRISRCSTPAAASLKLKSYLDKNFRENVSFADLAQRFRISASVLSRVFKRDWGRSPIQFRTHLRIMDAFRHLCEEEAITEVAYTVGFKDLSRFHKQFKRSIGQTPFTMKKKSKNAKK